MIRSRRTVDPDDNGKCCAKCTHLHYDKACFYCGIDGEYHPDPEIITICICRKFKEVKKTDGKL